MSSLFAANTFKAQIIDDSNNPIDGASILYSFNSKNYNIISGKDGYFIIKNLPTPSNLTLLISHLGFKEKTLTISSQEYQNHKTIKLTIDNVNLEEIIITGSRRESYIKDSPILTHVINTNDIQNSGYTYVKDVLEMSIPNVQNVISNHAGISNDRIKIKGLDNKYMLFLVDGVRVVGEFAGNLDFKMMTLSNIDRIEVVEGGMSSLYGSSAIGGVINVITKNNYKPIWLNLSYLYDDPMVISQSLNSGFNINNFNYSLTINEEQTDGYDLTPFGSGYGDSGVKLKTLEEYKSTTWLHKIIYKFNKLPIFNSLFNLNNKYSIELLNKNYKNQIYQYETHEVHTITPGPLYPLYYYESYKNNMPFFEDDKYGIKFSADNNNSSLIIAINKEKHTKGNYYFNYKATAPPPSESHNNCENENIPYFCNNPENLTSESFINAINENESYLLQYDIEHDKHITTLGFEKNNDKYSSFNIYNYNGDIDNNDQCDGSGFIFDPYDCMVESIFNSVDDSKKFSKSAYFIGTQWDINNNTISYSLRHVDSKNYKDNIVYSFAYMIKNLQPYDIRFNYSKGFRTPAIKELYYNWYGHDPAIIGNPKLKPTTNNYISLSLDKRTIKNNFSIEVYYNDVNDMIGINQYTNEVGDNVAQYNNFEKVKISGLNYHFERKLKYQNNLKFVYNYTNPKSTTKDALELISKHSAKLNYTYNILSNKIKFIANLKYTSEKFIFDCTDLNDNNSCEDNEYYKDYLEEFYLLDTIFDFKIKKRISLKIGCKNILNYIDDNRFSNDNQDRLTSYDPGRRYILGINLNY